MLCFRFLTTEKSLNKITTMLCIETKYVYISNYFVIFEGLKISQNFVSLTKVGSR